MNGMESRKVELAAKAELVKTDFSVQDDINNLDNKIAKIQAEATKTINLTNKKIDEYNALAVDLSNLANLASKINSELFKAGSEASQYLRTVQAKLKELGIDDSQIKGIGRLKKTVETMDSLYFSRLSAAENINPPKIGYNV